MNAENPTTYSTLAVRLVALGMISDDTARRALEEMVIVGEGGVVELGPDGDRPLEDGELPEALVHFGVALAVTGDEVGELASGYDQLLQEAAECTGGAVVIEDVEYVENSQGDDVLRFLRNGEPFEWSLSHDFEGYLAYMDIMGYIESGDLNPPAPEDHRTFRMVTLEETGDNYYVLATDEQAAFLEREFGLDLVW